MALADHFSAAARNAGLDAMFDLLNTGFLRIYSGTQPANVAAGITGTLLASLTFGATAFAAASGGSKTANAITQDSSADATNTATHYRCFASDGTTAHADGSVGTSGANLNLNSVAISSGAAVACSSFVASMAS